MKGGEAVGKMTSTKEYFELVRSVLADPVGADPGGDALAETAQDACVLARQAFELGNAAARHLAERILHLIHVGNSFAPPLQPVLSVYWSVLMRSKLTASLRKWGGTPELDPAELRPRLEALVKELGAWNHPLIDIITSSEDMHGLIVYTKNWFGS